MQARTPTLSESGYRGWPYIHTDYRRDQVAIVWWAKTPTGRQSTYLHWATIARSSIDPDVMLKDQHGFLCNVAVPTAHGFKTAEEIVQYAATKFPPPKLRAGYEWQGPFFYTEFDRTSVAWPEGQHGQVIVRHKRPARSENAGVPIRYLVSA